MSEVLESPTPLRLVREGTVLAVEIKNHPVNAASMRVRLGMMWSSPRAWCRRATPAA